MITFELEKVLTARQIRTLGNGLKFVLDKTDINPNDFTDEQLGSLAAFFTYGYVIAAVGKDALRGKRLT